MSKTISTKPWRNSFLNILYQQLKYSILASTNNKIEKLFNLYKKTILLEKRSIEFSKLEMFKLSDVHKHNASTSMYEYIKEKLPSSFNGMFAPFVDPKRTQGF